MIYGYMFDPVKIVTQLKTLPHEVEYVEFKENNSDPKLIGKEISAIANSAKLADVEFGYLIFGVENITHRIVGTSFKPRLTKIGNEDLELWLNKMLVPANFQIHEFQYDNLPLVLIQISASAVKPVKFQSQAYIRIGSNTRNLSDFPEKESAIWSKTRNGGFELDTALSDLSEKEILAHLDYLAYFELIKEPVPTVAMKVIDNLVSEGFIKRQAGEEFSITNLGAMLFAKNLSDFPSIRRKTVRVITYVGTNRINAMREREGTRGYAVGFRGLIDYINSQIPANEEIKRAYRVERKMYPEIAIRELVANSLIHQDFLEIGTGPTLEIFSDRVEISNPGKPLIDIDRFIDHKPQSRNERLAAFMRRIGICEERGSGIDKVVSSVEVFQLPAPKFEEEDKYVRVTLYSQKEVRQMSKEDRVRACYQHACLRYVSNDFMTNASLRIRFNLSETKTNRVFISNIISDSIKRGQIRSEGDPKARKSAKYVPYWA